MQWTFYNMKSWAYIPSCAATNPKIKRDTFSEIRNTLQFSCVSHTPNMTPNKLKLLWISESLMPTKTAVDLCRYIITVTLKLPSFTHLTPLGKKDGGKMKQISFLKHNQEEEMIPCVLQSNIKAESGVETQTWCVVTVKRGARS